MADLDLSDLFPVPPEQRQMGLAQALKGQQPQGIDMGQLGVMAALSEGRAAPFAQAAAGYGREQREAQGQMLTRMLEANRLKQQQDYQNRELGIRQQEAGNLNAFRRAELDAKGHAIKTPSGENYWYDPITQQLTPLTAGAAPGEAVPGAAAGGSTGLSPKDTERTAERYIAQMSPEKVAPDLWKKLQFGARIKPMIQQGLQGGQMNDQMARELASAFASYVSGGGAPAEEQIRSLLPPSFTGNLANLSNYLTNDLKGADRTAWLNQLSQSLEREEPVIQEGIRDALGKNDLGFPVMRKGALADTRKNILAKLKQQGYSLEDEPPPQKTEPAAGLNLGADAAPAAHPQDSAAVTWAKAHPDDPRAAKILAVNGGQ